MNEPAQDHQTPAPAEPPGLITAIGASAGGITALRPVLRQLPVDKPMSYVLLQHTDPTRMQELRAVLVNDCALPIDVAEDGTVLAAGRIYLVPPDQDCEFVDGRFRLQPAPKAPGARHSIDHAMASLAESYGDRSVGVILSGSGMDGLQGVRAIRSAGGVTIVQDPASAEYRSMPESVIDADLADLILTPEKIPPELVRILSWSEPDRAPSLEPEELAPMLRLLLRKTGFDFSQYKEGTVRRRLARRMLVNHCAALEEYRRLLVRDDDEADTLVRDLLISVTNFFRDGDIFSSLSEALRPLVESRGVGEAIRVWVPGCATGEEPYSIALVLAELLGEQASRVKIQIFATDVDAAAIREARQATYRAESVRAIPEPLLHKYFEHWDQLYRVRRDVRDMVVFAEHDLIQDPPFTRIDLISCRNVLIYFKRTLQEQLLMNFHYALRPNGLLLLGGSESADRYTRLFARADEHSRLYRRNELVGAPPAHLYRRSALPLERQAGGAARAVSPGEQVRDVLLEAYTPACALVNARQELLFVQGDVSRYVRLPQGELNMNLVEMAGSPEIRVELRLALNKVFREHTRVAGHPVALDDTDPPRYLRVVALPADDDRALVVFEDYESPRPAATAELSEETAAVRVVELEKELAATREHLHANIEELEASNEELQSMNEELQSTSEELQSTVEEYQTTNEELQSTNEELNTVNEELSAKSDALESTNADMQGILDNVAAAIIVLDRNLHVSRYSAASKEIFDLWPTTIGRPFIGIGGSLDLGLLSRDIHDAARKRAPVHCEMSLGGRCFDVRIIPRLNHSESLSGMIIVFTDARPTGEPAGEAAPDA